MALKGMEIETIDLPTLPSLFPHLFASSEQVEHQPSVYPDSPTQVHLDDVAAYLHSSGSTGLPKSVPINFGLIVSWFQGRT